MSSSLSSNENEPHPELTSTDKSEAPSSKDEAASTEAGESLTPKDQSASTEESKAPTTKAESPSTEENEAPVSKEESAFTVPAPPENNENSKPPGEDKIKDSVPPNTQPTGNAYKPPVWAMSCPVDLGYRLEVIKNGIPLPECTVHLSGDPENTENGDTELSFCLFGRQPQPFYAPYNRLCGQCIVLAHPSISRLHAVLQYGRPPPSIAKTSLASTEAAGWYIQDLDSTHGTFINKRRLPPGRFVRIHVGHVIRFGGSTRLNVLQGPDDDTEQESAQSWSEMKQAYLARKAAVKELAVSGGTSAGAVNLGCDWGLTVEDAASDMPNFLRDLNGAACLSHENLYQDDPKRALKAYFEREGIDPAPEFEFVEASFGKQHCKIDLPLASGTVTAEAITAGKRKEAIAQCALEACRLLDRLGEFDPNKDQSTAARRVRTKAYWEERDYYSSDEDTFTDRTGHVERKRLGRIRQLGVEGREAEEAERLAAERAAKTRTSSEKHLDSATLLTLLAELEKVGQEIVSLEEQLEQINKEFAPQGSNPSELDELEAYMNALKSGAPSSKERLKLKSRLFTLRQTEMRLFQKAGLPQPRQRVKLVASVGADGTQELVQQIVRTDAAAAVRAAKRKLEEGADTETSDKSASEKSSKNARLRRNEIKRSLAGHPTVQQAVPTRSANEDQPFEVEEDEDDEMAATTEAPMKEPSRVRDDSTPKHSKPTPPSVDVTCAKESPKPSTVTELQQEAPVERVVAQEDGVPAETEVQHTQDVKGPPVPSKRTTYGPTLPSDAEMLSQKKPRVKQKSEPDVYQQADPDYVTWVPPTDQKGDGITSLNAKYGY